MVVGSCVVGAGSAGAVTGAAVGITGSVAGATGVHSSPGVLGAGGIALGSGKFVCAASFTPSLALISASTNSLFLPYFLLEYSLRIGTIFGF